MTDVSNLAIAASDVRVETRGGACWITIQRESKRNALNATVVRAIAQAIEEAGHREEVRAIIITGAGNRAFCAGADLEKNVDGFAFAVDYARPVHYLVDLFKTMQSCRLPIIARVNGSVMAGGVGILCSCDMAIATSDAKFGTPETKIGLIPMMILPSMMRVIPRRKLLEMCITGEPLTAEEALSLGLVNYVVPAEDLDSKVDWLLSRITDKSPTAIRIGKQGFNAMLDMSLRDALEYAQAMLPVMASTEDAKEGIAAFQEKRKPRWTGN